MPQLASMREAYGNTLVELGKQNADIVVLDADLCCSTMTQFFAKEFPDRFFDCGIAEQNLISISAGLAASGKIPFTSTFAVFAPGRCFDQVRVSIAQAKLNVKLVTTHGGISVGEDGASHHAIEDLSLICSLPGFTVIVPADAIETAQALRAAAASHGPFYIRLCRPDLPLVYNDDYRFNLGKAVTLREGKDATIIAIGIMVTAAIDAAENLKQEGIDCRVINVILKVVEFEYFLGILNELSAHFIKSFPGVMFKSLEICRCFFEMPIKNSCVLRSCRVVFVEIFIYKAVCIRLYIPQEPGEKVLVQCPCSPQVGRCMHIVEMPGTCLIIPWNVRSHYFCK